MQQETLNAMALTFLGHFSLAGTTDLYRKLGSATAVMDHRSHIRDVLPEASARLVTALSNMDEAIHRAECELRWCEEQGIRVLTPASSDYPVRLNQCVDAPIALYYRGTADLNVQHVICIVGTRRSTAYGADLVRRFVSELQSLCPETLIVSGLAYGIDICAHREALVHGFNTVAVLAHGQDDLYPNAHRQTASEMLRQGGLLTEFPSGSRSEKVNFVRRNRIVAGMCDATILVESAAHGGGLITTDIANSYGREVFAFPGSVGLPASEGCNRLIRDNKAVLITSADDFIRSMNWTDHTLQKARQNGIERELFPELSPEEKLVTTVLSTHNDLQLNMLSAQSGLSVQQLTPVLFTLEMKGVVKMLPGSVAHLIV